MRKIVQNKKLDKKENLNSVLLNLCREVIALERGVEANIIIPELKAEVLARLSISVDEWGISGEQADVIDVYFYEDKMSELEYRLFEYSDVAAIEAVSQNIDLYIDKCKEYKDWKKRIRKVIDKIDELEIRTGIDFIGFYLGEE